MLGDNQELNWQGSATDGLKEVRKMEKYKAAPRFLPSDWAGTILSHQDQEEGERGGVSFWIKGGWVGV